MKTILGASLLKQMFILLGVCYISTSWAGELTVTVSNMDEIKGHVMLGVFAEKNADKFPSDDSGLEMIMINGNRQEGVAEKVTASSMTFTFDLPDGSYAISVYQDVNDDGKLGRIPFIGKPTEPYGFSNNPASTFGPPKFAKAAFIVEGETAIDIDLK